MAAPKVFGAPSAFKAFTEAPTGGDSFVPADHVGEGVLVEFVGVEEVATKSYGTKNAARMNVTLLNRGGAKVADVLVFSAAIVGQCEALSPGDVVVAKVEKYTSKFGTPGYKFAEPDPAHIEAANALSTEAPF
jgi:hypothetical protein